jgi:phosphoribosylformimino-5-aminoimidazole carboxamide ribotide isomerase
MQIIPAIDLKDGKCVRLLQGNYQAETIYAHAPAEVAQQFEAFGARRLHLVDLNGALDGKLVNLPTIEKIVCAVRVPIQLGGGIRTLESVENLLELGIDRVILGTIALRQPELVQEAVKKFGATRVIVGIDARNNQVAVSGWQEQTPFSAIDLALQMKNLGIERINYTDISRDGMLTGPNLEATKKMAEATGMKITASGGVSARQDIEDLKNLEPFGVDSVIVGKAIYEKRIELAGLFA